MLRFGALLLAVASSVNALALQEALDQTMMALDHTLMTLNHTHLAADTNVGSREASTKGTVQLLTSSYCFSSRCMCNGCTEVARYIVEKMLRKALEQCTPTCAPWAGTDTPTPRCPHAQAHGHAHAHCTYTSLHAHAQAQAHAYAHAQVPVRCSVHARRRQRRVLTPVLFHAGHHLDALGQ